MGVLAEGMGFKDLKEFRSGFLEGSWMCDDQEKVRGNRRKVEAL